MIVMLSLKIILKIVLLLLLFCNFCVCLLLVLIGSYGFENFELLEDYITRYPLLVPWKEYNTSNNSKWSICSTSTQEHTQPIKAILQLHEPVEWGEALQVLTDVLRSGGELNATGYVPDVRSPPPLHIANPDVTYAAHYSVPRFTSGAFILCLNTLYRHFTGKDLTPYLTFYGKPLRDTYRHIANLLVQRWNIQQKSFLSHSSSSTTSSSTSSFTSSFLPPPFTQIYAIGDNPLSDIRGANSVGWFSILVRTGIFQQGENDPTDPAQLVVPSVREAVQYILHKHHYLQE
jgi:HAD superfamily hydrolase (TIGR01456 family)